MTLENWNTLMYLALRGQIEKYFTIIYFVIWIFVGNYVLLNLFLAILLNGFGISSDQKEEYLDGLDKQDI